MCTHGTVVCSDAGTVRGSENRAAAQQGGRLAMRRNHNGPLVCTGPLILNGADGSRARDVTTFLCRCGGSRNKPYCDGTHKRIGFVG